jgi:hypothetical protein
MMDPTKANELINLTYIRRNVGGGKAFWLIKLAFYIVALLAFDLLYLV